MQAVGRACRPTYRQRYTDTYTDETSDWSAHSAFAPLNFRCFSNPDQLPADLPMVKIFLRIEPLKGNRIALLSAQNCVDKTSDCEGAAILPWLVKRDSCLPAIIFDVITLDTIYRFLKGVVRMFLSSLYVPTNAINRFILEVY